MTYVSNIAFTQALRQITPLLRLFTNAGYEARLVGGAVRDLILDKTPKDFDFCTNATPEQMLAMQTDKIAVIPTGIDHGTVTFKMLEGSFEVTTLRKDIECDGRHAKVEFTNSWKEDAERRDFTINAMSMDTLGKIYDYFDGISHLVRPHPIIKFVGDPDKRIKEDALRIMRFFRFIIRFDGFYERTDIKAIDSNINLLKGVSVERIWDEIKKSFVNEYDIFRDYEKPRKYLEMLYRSGVFEALGLEVIPNDGRLDGLTHYLEEFPTFGLGAILCDVDQGLSVFKLSKQEMNEVRWFHSKRHTDFDDFGFDSAADLINDGINRKWVKALASYLNNGFLEEGIDDILKTEFPVTGQHLIDRGFKSGVELGKELQRLRDIWKESRYQMDLTDLLQEIKV